MEDKNRNPMPAAPPPELTGIVVTAILILGIDMPLIWVLPIGILGGALATFSCHYATKSEQD